MSYSTGAGAHIKEIQVWAEVAPGHTIDQVLQDMGLSRHDVVQIDEENQRILVLWRQNNG